MSGPRYVAAVELPDEAAGLPTHYRSLALANALRELAAKLDATPGANPPPAFTSGTFARVSCKQEPPPVWPEPGAPAPAKPAPLGPVRDGLTPATGLPFEAIPASRDERDREAIPASRDERDREYEQESRERGPRAVLAFEERVELRELARAVLENKPIPVGVSAPRGYDAEVAYRVRRLAELAERAAQEPAEDTLAFSGPIAEDARKRASAELRRAGYSPDRANVSPDARVTGGEQGYYFVEASVTVAVLGTEYGEPVAMCDRCGKAPAVVEESRLCAECERQGAKLRERGA